MHRLLERQLRKAFGDDPPADIAAFLEQVDAAYEAADEDRRLLERAMELTSAELLERNEELSRRIAQVEEAHQQLAEADRWRQKFINAAAHELATPLTPLKLQVHTLAEIANDHRALAHSIDIMKRNVDRLAFLVSDLLDSARLQSDHIALRRTSIDLASIVRMSVESIRPVAKAAGIQVQVDTPREAYLIGDGTRLGQVLDNLLGNAVKFTPEGGQVRIAMDDGDPLHIHVRDTGVGMDGAGLRQLFRPFTRLHEDSHAHLNGTGLGLYVSRGIVEASGGTLEAESAGPDQGTTFIVTLPRSGRA